MYSSANRRSIRSPQTCYGDNESDRSVGSDRSSGPKEHRRLRPSGGYRDLRSFQTATVIYDATVSFWDRFVGKRSLTHDQMAQAARSGRQNIAEGSRAAATSSQTELRLVNVARASLDELLLDYEDFLRQRGKRQWKKDDPEARQVRAVGAQRDSTDPTDPSESYRNWLEHGDPAVVANAVICLIHQANYLLGQQIAALEREFIQEGGYTEQLATARLEHRRKQHSIISPPPHSTDPSGRNDPTNAKPKSPDCPSCGKPMVVRTARQGKQTGRQFWGCSRYRNCRGTLPLDG